MTQGKRTKNNKRHKGHSKSKTMLLNKVNPEFKSKKNKGLNLKVLESKDKNLKVLQCKDKELKVLEFKDKELKMQESKVLINSKQDKLKNQSSEYHMM